MRENKTFLYTTSISASANSIITKNIRIDADAYYLIDKIYTKASGTNPIIVLQIRDTATGLSYSNDFVINTNLGGDSPNTANLLIDPQLCYPNSVLEIETKFLSGTGTLTIDIVLEGRKVFSLGEVDKERLRLRHFFQYSLLLTSGTNITTAELNTARETDFLVKKILANKDVGRIRILKSTDEALMSDLIPLFYVNNYSLSRVNILKEPFYIPANTQLKFFFETPLTTSTSDPFNFVFEGIKIIPRKPEVAKVYTYKKIPVVKTK